jgi:hypothetical protein
MGDYGEREKVVRKLREGGAVGTKILEMEASLTSREKY